MLKFDNDHIFTGYLKQLLASFNLPKYKIYTKAHKQYKKNYGVESPEIIETVPVSTSQYPNSIRHIPYLKDGYVSEYLYDEELQETIWKQIDAYYTNKATLNYTKTLKIKNNIYDTYTHEYLGDFLRFVRDYFDINLMPLYNCFSNKICNNLLIDCSHEAAEYGSTRHFIFDSQDKNYKIYMLPVKLFQNYTIAIDCATKVELCCGIFNSYYDEETSDFLAHCTYKQYNGLAFNRPILYSELKEIYSLVSKESLMDLVNREQDLKLFIKVPTISDSSIVVLEGNYLTHNDAWTTRQNGKLVRYQNHTLTNLEDPAYANSQIPGAEPKIISAIDFAEREFNPITPLQLLAANTHTSYPFSDKLIEYLLGNVITSADENIDNIKRVHAVVAANTSSKVYNEDGFWDDRLRPILYNFAQRLRRSEEVGYDTLGYVDKVLEQEYSANMFNPFTNRMERTSIANIDIYPDIYLAMKQADADNNEGNPVAPFTGRQVN